MKVNSFPTLKTLKKALEKLVSTSTNDTLFKSQISNVAHFRKGNEVGKGETHELVESKT